MADRLAEVLLSGRWVANTNYKELLEDVTWQQATQKIGGLNSIVALTYHVNYYIGGILPVLKGGSLEIRDKFSFQVPKIESQVDWERMRTEFIANSEAFVEAVSNLPETQLDAVFVDEKYGTYARNIEGLIEHSYYHLGQISFLKKMITNGDRAPDSARL